MEYLQTQKLLTLFIKQAVTMEDWKNIFYGGTHPVLLSSVNSPLEMHTSV